MESEEVRKYIRKHDLEEKMAKASHILRATGESLVPPEVRGEYKNTYLK